MFFKVRNQFFSPTVPQAKRWFVDNQGLIVNRERDGGKLSKRVLRGDRGLGKPECCLLSATLSWHLKLSLSRPIARKRQPLPGDVRLSPWSHNILAATWLPVHLSLKGTRADVAGSSGSDTGSLSAPPAGARHTQRRIQAAAHPPQGTAVEATCVRPPHVTELGVTAVSHAGSSGALPGAGERGTQANVARGFLGALELPSQSLSSSQCRLYSIRHEAEG